MIRPVKWLKIIWFFILIVIFVIIVVLNVTERAGKVDDDSEIVEEYTVNVNDIEVSTEQVSKSIPGLPWYFQNGTKWPTPGQINAIWPNQSPGDRILNQLMFIPSHLKSDKLKKIYINEIKPFQVELGREIFLKNKCPVSTCLIVNDMPTADAVIYRNYIKDDRDDSVPPDQIWILFTLENPFHTSSMTGVNWTATYRTDSDIVAPYAKWVYYNESITKKPQDKNYAKGKSKKVAWLVSNCHPQNNRQKYAEELRKFIDVDIYGRCGGNFCPRNGKCLERIGKDYKFYLAFENGNCRDYITEKFFENALSHDMLPIVMGAHPVDYRKLAPRNSYIHVNNFSSPKHLAEYLHHLDENDDLYNSFFEWKGTGEFINTYFFCRVCAMLHSNYKCKVYKKFDEWWGGDGVCTKRSWLKN